MKFFYTVMLFGIFLGMAACVEDDDSGSTYEVPDTYSFSPLDYSGQVQRIGMLYEMKNYMASASISGTTLDADRLKAMFTNAAAADFIQSYEPTKQLRNKTFDSEQTHFESLMEAIALASQSLETATQGQAGRITTQDGIKTYLLGEGGVEYAQVIEKGLMGACFYFQSTAVYMGESKMNVDNSESDPEEGTAMEHHWDEAFGYFGVPIDFPFNTDGLFFWGDYSQKRNAILDCNRKMMDNFIRGRAAISNNDLETRDLMIVDLREEWERIIAASALHYINVAINNFEDSAIRMHALSEAVAFIYCLKFNPEKSLTIAQIDAFMTDIGGSANFLEMNLYSNTISNLLIVRDELAAAFQFSSIKDQF